MRRGSHRNQDGAEPWRLGSHARREPSEVLRGKWIPKAVPYQGNDTDALIACGDSRQEATLRSYRSLYTTKPRWTGAPAERRIYTETWSNIWWEIKSFPPWAIKVVSSQYLDECLAFLCCFISIRCAGLPRSCSIFQFAIVMSISTLRCFALHDVLFTDAYILSCWISSPFPPKASSDQPPEGRFHSCKYIVLAAGMRLRAWGKQAHML